MYKILVTACNDDKLWYSDKVGEFVEFRGEAFSPHLYRSTDDTGSLAFIQPDDAKVIWSTKNDVD